MTTTGQHGENNSTLQPAANVPTSAALAELLTRASWRLKKNERKDLAPFGVTFAQARALRVLVDQGEMRIGDLADLLEIVPRSATTRVDGLEDAGLVSRRADPTDRRSVLVAPTHRGRQLVARLTADRRESAQALFAPLSEEDRTTLLRLLHDLTKDS